MKQVHIAKYRGKCLPGKKTDKSGFVESGDVNDRFVPGKRRQQLEDEEANQSLPALKNNFILFEIFCLCWF
jgi:hypothetical protein